MRAINEYIKGLAHLFFPHVCAGCNGSMAPGEDVLCLKCELKLPETRFHKIADNPCEKKFWGRVNIERASSFLFFEKGSGTQKLMQLLKYQGRQDIGSYLGRLFAEKIKKDAPEFCSIDAIIAVPLHDAKLRSRGYNQCDPIVHAFAESWQKPVYKNVLIRTHNNITQTGKNRMGRWENVHKIFAVAEPDKIKNKHILLIDDVLTTGATLEACAQEILEIEGTRISILTLACAM
jgi:ComF family protein